MTETGELVLDVTDHNPAFPGFDQKNRAGRGRGMRRLARLDARLTWFPRTDGTGKTVRAVLPRGEEGG
ncbi:hypothetical protein ABZX85_27720 [Streptomyces sp. NPDC004539]|uniref:hypothetical protein n=1 Tax=Streptomyces sp. NPDC004539 TaxID=3154280 RepID=UPI0033A9B11F